MYLTITFFIVHVMYCNCTIDINAAELQYLADHLSPEECRRLIAAAHFPNFEEPNALFQAQRKIPQDIQCMEHLHHWNSQMGEGKGQTHEVLEHRLRQMGKTELADWLGKTVFHQIGVDLEKSIIEGITDETKFKTELPTVTFEPLLPKIQDPTDYTLLDWLLYLMVIGLVLAIFTICCKLIWSCVKEAIRKKKLKQLGKYEFMESGGDSSESEYEENKIIVNKFYS